MKAFDSVDRNNFWAVLCKHKTVKKLQGVSRSVQSCARRHSQMSDFFECPARVKQVYVLSALIAVVFLVNDWSRG